MTSNPKALRPPLLMPIIGGVVLAGLAIYYGFMAINSMGLPVSLGEAEIVGMEFRESSNTYATQRIGGSTQTVMRTNPAMYVLHLRLQDQEVECAVEKERFEQLSTNDQVRVEYQRYRLTGGLVILQVSP